MPTMTAAMMPCLRRPLPEQQHHERRQVGRRGDAEGPADEEVDVHLLEQDAQHDGDDADDDRRDLGDADLFVIGQCRCLKTLVDQIVRRRRRWRRRSAR